MATPGSDPQGIDELEKEVHAMRKMILTGALFARLTRKDRLTLPYSYY
ncbi:MULTISPECIES: cittilin family RiPP precursor [Streptomyces]|uniref:Cittilin family RiPP n=2 Tax=Streptomyces TaxID=1883 RepID=A0ABW7SXU1_9ACTN|nr:cittilin family RiPP precursor [Streptomyces luteoverticillatus]